MPINSFLLPGAKFIPAYEVANSCRFNDGDSPSMSKTQGTATNVKIFTVSMWVKRCTFGADQHLWETYLTSDAANDRVTIQFMDSDRFRVKAVDGGSTVLQKETSRLCRDPSAWYHIVVAVDTTDSTAANRCKIYINGTQETSFSTDTIWSQDVTPEQGTSSYTNIIGKYGGGSNYFDGYMAEVVFIDGQQLTPTSFGEFDEDSPTIWKPKDVSGLTFGTNGFYLDFEASDNLGNDVNGGTDLTEVNLAATDQATDTPTNNFATMNPLDNYIPASTFSEGNLKVVTQSTGYQYNTATFGLTAGKWYYEMKLISKTGAEIVGIAGRVCGNSLHYLGYYNDGWGYHSYDGKSKNNETGTSYGDTWDVDDTVVGVFIDLDNNKLYFAKDGTIQNSGTGISITDPASVNDGAYYPAVGDNWNGGIGTYEMNFGNPTWSLSSAVADANGYGSFEYDPSDGGSSSFDSAAKDFLAICTKNLAEYG